MSDELKPCPFCGSTDIRFHLHRGAGTGIHGVWSTCCYDCGAIFPNRYKRELLVECWNRRPAAEAVTLSELAALLPGPYYMDPPDGGDVPVLEQIKRMADDARKWREAVTLNAAAPDLLEALLEIDTRLRACIEAGASAQDAYDSFYQEIVSEAFDKARGVK